MVRNVTNGLMWRNRALRAARQLPENSPRVTTWIEAQAVIYHEDVKPAEDLTSLAIKTGRPACFIVRVKLVPHSLARVKVCVWPVACAAACGAAQQCGLLLANLSVLL